MRAVPSGSDLPEPVDTRDSPLARAAPSGARSGALLAAASVVAIGLNYVFLLTAARLLGSDDYGTLAALLGLLTVILLPTGAVQLGVSREVSRRVALGDAEGADAFGRATLRLGLLLTAPLIAVALALVIPLRELLNIESTGAVALAVSGLVAALVLPITMGALQGYQRFHAIAALYVLPFAIRLALLAAIAAAGYHLGGAVLAAVAGGVATAAVALVLLREPLRRGALAARPVLGPFLRYLWPVVVGLIGVAVLTNVDLLVVKARFSDDAGAYAAASAFARVAFFLPATILAVLFPRTAARQARGEDTADILGRSLLVTAAFGTVVTLFYAMTGQGLVHTSFGAEFADGGELLVPFTVSMVLFALANALVGYHLSRDETRYAWIVAGAVPIQIAVLALVPGSVRSVIWADIAIGLALLAAHELAVESSLPALRAGWRHVSAVRIPRRALREALLVLVGATAFVLVLFWPVTLALDSTVVGRGSDAFGTVWWFWRLQQEGGYHLFGTTQHILTGAPFGWNEGNGLNLQLLLPYYPGYLLTKIVGPVAAFNVVLLSGYVLSAASMYLLARYLGCAWFVSTWAAVAYVVFPAHLERTPHASLVHLEFLPLLILALAAAARRPTWLRFSLVGLVTLACWLTSGYFGTMAFVTSVAFALGAGLAWRWRRGAKLVLGSTLAAAAASLLIVIFAASLAGVGRDAGLDRVAGDLSVYGLRPTELVVPSADNLLVGEHLQGFYSKRLHGSNPTETNNYLGLLTILLAAAWLVVAWRRRKRLSADVRSATAGLVAVVVAGLAFAAPSPIGVFGHLWTWTPSRILWEFVPAFRVPSRWTVLVMTALVPLAALGLQTGWAALGRRNARRSRVAAASVALVAIAMLISFLELTVPPADPRIETTLPPEYAALEGAPRGILAEYPLIEDLDNLFWQQIHGRPVLNNSAFGTAVGEANRVLVDPSAPGTASQLALLGVTAILTHADALDYKQGIPDVPNASWGSGYELVARTPNGSSVWRVVAEPAPALVTLPGGFTGPTRPTDGVVGYPLVSPSGVGEIQFTTRSPGTVRLTFDATPPQGRQVLRLVDSSTDMPFTLEGRTRVSVLVRIPRGRSILLVKTDPAATSEADAVVLSAPRAERSSGAAQLQAEPVSPDPGF